MILTAVLFSLAADGQEVKGDTLVLKIDTKIRFIKIGDAVFELTIKPELKPVEKPFNIRVYNGNPLYPVETELHRREVIKPYVKPKE